MRWRTQRIDQQINKQNICLPDRDNETNDSLPFTFRMGICIFGIIPILRGKGNAEIWNN